MRQANGRKVTAVFGAGLALVLGTACGGTTGADGSGSEVATSVVSGALNNTTGSTLGWNDAPREPRPSVIDRIWDEVNPIRPAWAAAWTCMGGTLAPAFAGPGAYTYTPVSCSVTWRNGKSASSEWSSTFDLNYGPSCDDTHPWFENQAGGCAVTRTTGTDGNTRTVTGPLGSSYSVTHNTNGAGTGWDSSVSPAPNNDGLVVTCDSDGCSKGLTLVINGSHLTGTTQLFGGSDTTKWDHTVTSSGITVTGSGNARVASGSVTVQHNLAKFTSTTTFNDVGFAEGGCCFPTTGSVSTSFSGGPYAGKSESIAFSAVCGEATLTTTAGTTESITLQHCL
jgi:hypothetical protein